MRDGPPPRRPAAGEVRVTAAPVELPGLTIPLAGSSPYPGSQSVALLVNETGGDIFLAQPSTLDDALSCAVTRLRMRYTLAYAPTIFSTPGRYHPIQVVLAERFGKPGTHYTVRSRYARPLLGLTNVWEIEGR